MDISTQPHVVSKVPANVVWIFEDGDIVAIPGPVTAVADIEIGNAEVESAEPEAARSSASETPYMATAEASGEMAVLPWMVKMETGVVASIIVADPLAVSVDVGSLGMTFLVAEILFRGTLMRRRGVGWCRTVTGNVTAADSMAAAVIAMLSPSGQTKD